MLYELKATILKHKQYELTTKCYLMLQYHHVTQLLEISDVLFNFLHKTLHKTLFYNFLHENVFEISGLFEISGVRNIPVLIVYNL